MRAFPGKVEDVSNGPPRKISGDVPRADPGWAPFRVPLVRAVRCAAVRL